MCSVVALSCEVWKGRGPIMSRPRIEMPDTLVTVAVPCPLEEALRLALREMILWMRELTGMSGHDAYVRIGIANHARLVPGPRRVTTFRPGCEKSPQQGVHQESGSLVEASRRLQFQRHLEQGRPLAGQRLRQRAPHLVR
jgi:hypothetical protein